MCLHVCMHVCVSVCTYVYGFGWEGGALERICLPDQKKNKTKQRNTKNRYNELQISQNLHDALEAFLQNFAQLSATVKNLCLLR